MVRDGEIRKSFKKYPMESRVTPQHVRKLLKCRSCGSTLRPCVNWGAHKLNHGFYCNNGCNMHLIPFIMSLIPDPCAFGVLYRLERGDNHDMYDAELEMSLRVAGGGGEKYDTRKRG